MTTVLLLAGTSEARALSHRLAALPGIGLTASLAGVTRSPAAYGGRLRSGGFGGVPGLQRYLSAEGIGAVIDATHPFAATMHRNAAIACSGADVPLLRLERPEWVAPPGADWRDVADLGAAIGLLPAGAVGFIAAGRSAGPVLAARQEARFVLRAIEAPPEPLPANVRLILGRPSEDAAAEMALLRAEGVTHLICKNSGGPAGRAKLDAAAALGVPVLMIRRPPRQPVPTVATVGDAVRWLRAIVANAAGSGASRA